MKPYLKRSLLTLFGASVCIVQPLTVHVAESATLSTASCSEVQLPVALAPGEPKQYLDGQTQSKVENVVLRVSIPIRFPKPN